MNTKIYKNTVRVILCIEFIAFLMPPLLFAAVAGLGFGLFFFVLLAQTLVILFTQGPAEVFIIIFKMIDSNWSLDSFGGKIFLILVADLGLVALLKLTTVAFLGKGVKSVPLWTWLGIILGWWVALDISQPLVWEKEFFRELPTKLMFGFGAIILLFSCLIVLLANSSLNDAKKN